MEGQGEISRTLGEMSRTIGENNESSSVGGRRSRDENKSINDDGFSGDDVDAADKPSNKKKKTYHKNTPQQLQELENLYKECPRPAGRQMAELSRRLKLETRQVKFWFQNRRTQMKTQIERHENSTLRQENNKLRAENMSIKDAMRNPICNHCGGPAVIGELSIEEQHLKLENARLKEELDRASAMTGKFLGRGSSSMGPPMPNSSLELGVGNNGFGGLNMVHSTLPFGVGLSSPMPIMSTPTMTMNVNGVLPIDRSGERSMLLELALVAMDELLKLAQIGDPLWVRDGDGGKEILNHDEYLTHFTPSIGIKPIGFVTEATRESGTVLINSLALVETLMDSNKWQDMFPGIVAKTITTDVISSGMGGSRNGALQLMHAELQVLSPLVPVREVNFLRFCKQHAKGVWAVVDVSIDTIQKSSGIGSSSFPACRRLPSGCVVQDMPNGYSKVTWVEHAQYDETAVHHLYRNLIRSGLGFGAHRWFAALQRQCECLAILMSSAVSPRDHTAITGVGRKSMLKLAQRMTNNFCAGVCASTIYKWNKLQPENMDEGIRVMTRRSMDNPGEPSGIVVSVATSVWFPVSPEAIFNFLRNEGLRSEWDILSNGGPMQEMAHIAKGQDHGNRVSLLRSTAMNSNQSSMLILQETCIDDSGALVVYAPVDIPAIHVVMNGGDSAYVALLPSGFVVTPDGPSSYGQTSNGPSTNGSLLSVAFQILVSSLPSSKLTMESVEKVNNLLSCTVQKIKAALNCEN